MTIVRKTCRAPDGLDIVYSVCGAGKPALLFIHGGLANRTFWDGQLEPFGDRHRVVAPDLAGHGESGTERSKWGIPECGADIKAVADAEKLEHVILFGNSLGGPVGVEAALLMPDRVTGVVGIDTFHSLAYTMSHDEAHARGAAFRDSYAASLRQMVKMLFHPDADPAVVAEAERRMQTVSPAAAYEMFVGLGGYDPSAATRHLTVPLRAINGDLFPIDLAGVRAIKPDFEATVMRHIGHYPMLERPDEFNRHVAALVESLGAAARAAENRTSRT